jgi:tetratricopeptide (TPR) repeat protein
MRRLIAVLLLGAWAGAAMGPACRALADDAEAPGRAAGGFDERWLSEIVLDELKKFSATGEHQQLAERMKNAILARLMCGQVDRLAGLNDMMYVFRACAYLPMAEEATGGKELAEWLLEHREVSRRLFRAMEDVEKPAESLKALWELVTADEKAVLKYPELAAAFATSQPLAHYRPQPEACSMLESFRYYTRSKVSFRYDLKKMPYEISRYLADTRLDLKERRWAAERYKDQRNPAKSYFDLKYDQDHYRKGQPKRIEKRPYTLPNLLAAGGVCIEQAYYAAEVCKALGVPATIVSGRGGSGLGHAWMACLKVAPGGEKAYWDSDTGRYSAHKYYTGEVRSPATGRRILDNELMLVGAAAQLPLNRREEADTAVALARMVERVRDGTPAVNLDVLKALASRYGQSKAQDQPGAEAGTDWIRERRKLDLALVEDLIEAAVARNVACNPAWVFIIEMRKSDRLPVKDLDRFFNTLVSRTARAFPDYSCAMVVRIVPTIDDASIREKVYRRALNVYGGRPDLAGRVLTALGDDYRRQDRKDKALLAYEQAAIRAIRIAEVVLEASRRAESLLVDARRRDMAINMYKKLFSKAEKETTAFRDQTAHYQLGMRLAQLLRDDGQEAAARRVLEKL